MPYSGISDPKLPEHVQKLSADKRKQWIAVFERVLDDQGDEGRAMAAANAAVKSSFDDDQPIYIGGGIKAMDEEGRIGGYLASWGDAATPDLQGEWFTAETDFALNWYDTRPALYHHGLDQTIKSQRVGVIDHVELRPDAGLWAEAQLDLHDEYIKQIWKLVKAGKLSWSSGSIPHQVKVEAGEIKFWPIVEGSLTPTPAEFRNTSRIISLKSLMSSDVEESTGTKAQPDDTEAAPRVDEIPPDPTIKGSGEQMNREQILTLAQQIITELGTGAEVDLDQIADQVAENHPEPAEPIADAGEAVESVKSIVAEVTEAIKGVLAADAARQAKDAAVKNAVNSLKTSATPESRAPESVKTHDDTVSIEVKTRYEGLSAEDMSYMVDIRAAIEGWQPDTAFLREMADKTYKAIAARDVVFDPKAVKSVLTMKDMSVKADELVYSTQASYGDEWVPTLWSDQLWMKARQDNVILPRMRVVEMPSNPYELPLESTDPTVYYVPETTDENQLTISGTGNPIPDSKLGTNKVTLTASKLALRVGVSEEATEDSIIPLIPQLREQATRTIMDAMDNVILNADDTASGNINLDGGTPAATAKYMAFSYGLRHTGLIDNSAANAVSAAGQRVTMALLRSSRFTLPGRYSVRPDEIAYITNAETFATMLGIDEVMTLDKLGPNATVLNGMLAKIDGSPLLVTAELGLSATNGKISSTAGNNVYGQINTVHLPSWVLGYRRRVRTAVEYISYMDAYQMTVTVRFAIARRDVECVSTLYYLQV